MSDPVKQDYQATTMNKKAQSYLDTAYFRKELELNLLKDIHKNSSTLQLVWAKESFEDKFLLEINDFAGKGSFIRVFSLGNIYRTTGEYIEERLLELGFKLKSEWESDDPVLPSNYSLTVNW